MRQVWKWSLRSAAAIGALLVLLAVTLVTILNTERGSRWALQRIDAAVPGELLLADVSGTFWRGLELSSIRYHHQDRDIEAGAVAVRIDWSSILTGRLSLLELRAARLLVRSRSKAAPDPAGLTLSMTPLPFSIGIESAAIGELTLENSGAARQFENIALRHATVTGNSVRAAAFAISTSGLDIDAQEIQLTLDGDVAVSVQVSWALADKTWSGQGQVRGSLALLDFEQSVAGAYPFHAQGTVQILRRVEPVVDATVSWQNWILSNYSLPRGHAQLRGTISRYDLDYAATAITPEVGEVQIAGSGSGNLQQLDGFTVQVFTETAAAELSGSLSWLPDLSARAEFAASGLLAGAPVAGQGAIEFAPEFIRCSSCALAVGKNKLRVDGELAAGTLGWTLFVDAPELHTLRPEIAGIVQGEVRLQGSLSRPHISGAVRAEQLSYGGWHTRSIAIDIEDSIADAARIRARVAELRSGDNDYGSFDVLAGGTLDNVRLEVDWLVRGLSVGAAGSLQRHGDGFAGHLERATINEPTTGDWILQNTFAFQITDAAVSIEPHLWSGKSGHLQVSRLNMFDEEIAIVVDIERIPLSLADSWLPDNYQLLGDASANIDVARRANTWSGSMRWQQQDTLLRIIEGPDQVTDVRAPRAELQANFLDGGIVAQASLSIEPGVVSEIELQLSSLDADAIMQAELHIGGDDWSWITAVVPEIDGLQGSISASLSADGPLLAPQLSGDLVWRDGAVVLPAMNVPLKNIELVISGAAQGTATVAGSAKAGDGTLAVTGTIQQLMQSSRSIALELSGKSAEIINWPEYHVWGSPKLTIVGSAEGWQLSGDLVVPRAEIEVREIPVEATTVSSDVVVLGEEEIRIEPTRIAGEVRLVLGKQVRIKALGLDTGLAGELLLRLRQDRATSAEGRIALENGSFAAQGQKLAIQKGELTFTGPLDNPIVDVRAVRVIDTFDSTVTAGIHLHGRAQDLRTTVFSEPTMNEVDALSYLVIGRPLREASEAEGSDLSGAAVSLGLRQATRLTEQIGQSLGLDQLSLSGDGGDSTMLIAGTKVGSRLYARYAYGIFSRLGTLLLRYKLSDRLTLEAGAGEAQSIDILYSVEKH